MSEPGGTPIGAITIYYWLSSEGEPLTRYRVDGDLPVVEVLGLLALTADAILHGPDDE